MNKSEQNRVKNFLSCLGNGKTLDEIETEELEMEQEDETN
jgi:hypothetical protein